MLSEARKRADRVATKVLIKIAVFLFPFAVAVVLTVSIAWEILKTKEIWFMSLIMVVVYYYTTTPVKDVVGCP